MPNPVNPQRDDLSVSIGTELKQKFYEACKEDNVSLTHATREALRRWLDAREKRIKRRGGR